MIEATTGEAQAGSDVVGLEIRKLLQHLFTGKAACEQIQHVGYTDAHPADAGPATALLRIDGDSLV